VRAGVHKGGCKTRAGKYKGAGTSINKLGGVKRGKEVYGGKGGSDQGIIKNDGRDDVGPRDIKVREGTHGVSDEPIHGDDGRGEDGREEHVGDERIMTGTVSVVWQIVAAEVEDFVKDRAQREASLRCLEPSTSLVQSYNLSLVCGIRS
jgi:hypothetical protein